MSCVVVGKKKKTVKKMFFSLSFALAFASHDRVRPSLGRLAQPIGKYWGSLSGGAAAGAAGEGEGAGATRNTPSTGIGVPATTSHHDPLGKRHCFHGAARKPSPCTFWVTFFAEGEGCGPIS